MNNLVNSLMDISTGYSVFQKDQVLTEAQLNSVSHYLDDQDRLSRVNLTGVGIVCGLEVDLTSNRVSLSPGVGITTDGDLMRIGAGMSFRRFKIYDKQYPAYDALYADSNTMFKAYELVPAGQTDPLAKGLNLFGTETGLVLREMFAVLLMESYIQTHDLCSGAGCDNHSQNYVGKIKLLLVEKAALGKLMPLIQTSDSAARSLDGVVAQRALVAANTTTHTELMRPFREAAKTMHDQLQAEFRKFWPACQLLMSGTFEQDPAPAWVARMNRIRNAFNGSQSRVQYYYDFLRDVVDTWNEMRSCLFGENAWCCPEVDGFPKHLLLGSLASGPGAGEHRFAFYPSAAVNRDAGLKQAVFLAAKIDALLDQFNESNPVASPGRVMITPSHDASAPLGKRAIPCYFKIDSTIRMVREWNYKRSQRGEERYNYSCNHTAYNARGAAAQPLASAIDGNEFFRIEGHIGRNVDAVQRELERQVQRFNLPFSICSILIGSDRKDLVIRPFPIYTDLNRFHYMIRQDLVQKMDEVEEFGNTFEAGVFEAVKSGIVRDDSDSSDQASVKTLARESNNRVKSKARAAKGKLARNYTDFIKDKSWMKDVGETMVAASQFKRRLNKVVNTTHPTSFDSLIGNPTFKWLPWLDKFLEDKNKNAEEKNLFARFLADHPGLEHAAGVCRGGVFVLVYKKGGEVVADFMLSHCCEKEVEEQVPEPPLFKPQFPIGEVLQGGIKFNPSRDHFVKNKLDILRLDIDERWQPKLDATLTQNTAITGLLDVMKTRATQPKLTIDPGLSGFQPGGFLKPGIGDTGITGILRPGSNQIFKDEVLGIATERVRAETEIIKVLNEKIEDPNTEAVVKRKLLNERNKSETKLKRRIEEVATQLESSNPEADFGSEAHDSLAVVATGMTVIKDDRNRTDSVNAIKELSNNTTRRKSLRLSAAHILKLGG